MLAARRVLHTPVSAGGGGPVAWWKADSLSLSDGDPVGSWADSSGNGLTATAAGSQRPTYKTAIVNGLPVVRISAGQWLAFTPPSVSDMTCFLVHTVAAGDSSYGGPFCCRPSGATGFAFNTQTGSPGEYQPLLTPYTAGSEGTSIQAGAGIIATPIAARLYSWKLASGVATAWFNSVSETVANGTSGWGNSGGLIGQAYGTTFEGDFCEIQVYDYAMTDAERTAVEGPLITKWGL